MSGRQEPREGHMVVTTYGTVGMLVDRSPNGWAYVRFGNNTPLRRYRLGLLRVASMEEITAAGLHGVGCLQGEEGGTCTR